MQVALALPVQRSPNSFSKGLLVFGNGASATGASTNSGFRNGGFLIARIFRDVGRFRNSGFSNGGSFRIGGFRNGGGFRNF